MVRLRHVGVAALLASPVVAVLVVAWPEGGFGGGGGGTREEGSGPDGSLVRGDLVEGSVGVEGVATWTLVGDGDGVRVGARATSEFDGTVTVVDDDGGEVAYNDDTNGLDPEVQIEVDEGEEVTVEVRELSGRPGTFIVYVD